MSTASPFPSTPTLDNKVNGPYGQIILFGDSITENAFEANSCFSYAAALSYAYIRKLDVVNRGFSGYNTDHATMVFPRFMPTPAQAKVELMIICFGANDACLPHDPTGHHVPMGDFRKNLVSLITSPLLGAHNARVLLVTPPPVDEYQQKIADQAKGFEPVRRTAENTKLYAQACKEVGEQLGVPVVDIWTSFLRHAGWAEDQEELPGSRKHPANKALQSLFSDGLHPSSSGYMLLYKEVMDSIRTNFPDMDPEYMSYRCPPWEWAPKPRLGDIEHSVE